MSGYVKVTAQVLIHDSTKGFTRCRYDGVCSQMNKFDQVSSDDYQMPVTGLGIGHQVRGKV